MVKLDSIKRYRTFRYVHTYSYLSLDTAVPSLGGLNVMPGSFNNSNPSVDMVKMLRIILWNNGIHEILTDYHKCYSVTLPSKKYLKSSFFARKSVLKICSFRDWKEICSHRLQRSANIPTKSVHKHICVC